MKKTVLIICLSAITTFGFSQTKTPTKAPKSNNNATQPASSKPAGAASGSEKLAKPANSEGNSAAPETNPIDNSKAIANELITALLKSENKLIDKEQLSSAATMVASANNNEELYNALRMIIESAPAGVYKSGNVEAGRQMAGNFNSDLELGSFNSLLLKWEMLLNPICFDASWKTSEAKWKKQIQGIK
jgi:hypothetical protein